MVFLALLAAGVVSGMFGALLGLGGGIFLVPALTLLFDLPLRVAVGTSLVAVIATSAGVALVMPKGRGADLHLGLRLEVSSVAGAILGGAAAGLFSQQAIGLVFAFVVFLTAAYVIQKHRLHARRPGDIEQMYRSDYRARHWPFGLGMAGLAGGISGLLGIGGGFIKVPVMYAVMDVPLGVATATSNFMVGLTAAASVFLYYGRGDIHPLVAIPTAVGVFGGAILGVYALSHLRVAVVRLFLVGLLVVMGVQMLLHSLK